MERTIMPNPEITKLIPLTQGHFAIVDIDDYEAMSQYSWQLKTNTSGGIYARARIDGKWKFMHRLIMNPAASMDIDHINGNGLDNRRSNLRICTHANNSRNQRKSSKHKYKGIYFDKHRNTWRAQIVVNGLHIKTTRYKTDKEAALAYNALALKHFGDYAHLNGV
jgi:hypothetical protein